MIKVNALIISLLFFNTCGFSFVNAQDIDLVSSIDFVKSRANTLRLQGKEGEAIELYKEVLSNKIPSITNLSDSDAAEIWSEKALIYIDLGSYALALSALNHAIELVSITKVDRDRLNIYQNNKGMVLHNMGKFEEAAQIQEEVLKYEEDKFGLDHYETLTSISNLALTYYSMGRYNKALQLQERSLAIDIIKNGEDHLETSISMNNLANTLTEIGRYEEALVMHLRSLEVRKKFLGDSDIKVARSYGNISSTYYKIGLYEQALKSAIKGLDIFSKILGEDHPTTLIEMNGVASKHNLLGNYDKALPIGIKSANNLEKIFGIEHPRTLEAFGNLALIYSNLGRFQDALKIEKKVYEIKKITLGPSHPETVIALSNLASTHFDLKEFEDSRMLEELAVEINSKNFGVDHQSTIESMANLSVTYYKLSDYNKSLDYQLKAIQFFEKTFGLSHPKIVRYYNNLASIYLKLDNDNLSLKMREKSLWLSVKLFGSYHPTTAHILNNISRDMLIFGNNKLSSFYGKWAINAFQNQRMIVSNIDVENLRSYTLSIEEAYRSFADFLISDGRLDEAQQVLDMLKEDELFEFIRRSSDADPRRTRIGFTPEEARWASGYKEVSDRLAALGAEQRELQQKAKRGLSAAEKARAEAIKAELAVAEKAFKAFLSDMQRTLKAQGPAKVDGVAATSLASQRELQSLIRDLGPGVVLLQYYVTNNKVGMILTTPDVVIPFSTEIDSRTLNRQVFQLRNALRDPRSNVLSPAQELYRLLLAPVVIALEQSGAKTVMLSLDGQLRHVPFGALHDGKQFAAQKWSLPIYTAVTRDRLREGGAQRWTAAGLGVTRAIGEFKALPAVRAEMDNLLRATGGQSRQSVVYLDERFTAQRLKEVGQRDFQLMHISSHFSISPGTEANSFLLLGDGQRLTLGDIRTQNFRFDNVDLLTLAACDTGVGGGRDSTGKEVEGLGVIAQQQGAKAVLATLWPVADGSTAKLMTDMYQRHQTQGLSKIEALRQAQLAMMSQPKYAHPFYWAPFILLGNWQ